MPRRTKPQHIERYIPPTNCANKQRYSSEANALKAVELLELQDMKLSLGIYHCPYCNGWHLTSST